MRARARLIAVLAVVTLVAMACSNASSDKSSGSTTTTAAAAGGGGATVDQPGVTKDTIRVGGVASMTNPLNGPYKSAFDGVKAYFDMVNSAGGIYGRKLELVSERDDQMAQNQEQVEALLAQDNVFAVAPIATIFSFSGAQALVDANVPTFGWNINDEYTGHPNLFGSNSGALCLGCAGSQQPYVAKALGKKKIGVLAYNVASSADCADGIQKSFDKYPVANVVFLTKSLSFGATDFSVEVSQMKDKGVDFVLTCVDNTAALNLAKEMRKQDLKAIQYLPNGYDAELVKANKQFFEGDIVGVQFAPFETRPKPPGLVRVQQVDGQGRLREERDRDERLDLGVPAPPRAQGGGAELHPPEGDRRPEQDDRRHRRRPDPSPQLDEGTRDHARPRLHFVRQGRRRQVRPDVHAAREALHVLAGSTREAADQGNVPLTGLRSRP